MLPTRFEWEEPVQTWLKENHFLKEEEFGTRIAFVNNQAEIPTDIDNIFNATTLSSIPKIRFISPPAGSMVSFGSTMVRFETETPNGFKGIKFYLGPAFRGVVNSPDQKEFRLEIIPGLEAKEQQLRAVITDELGLQGETSMPLILVADPDQSPVAIKHE